MNDANMEGVVKVLIERNFFLITSHVNPEGDSIGSEIAVYTLLKKMGKEAVMTSQDGVPDNLRFLPKSELIKDRAPGDFTAGTIIVLDCPVKERVGDIRRGFGGKELVVNIDHHVSNEYFGDINWVEPEASSVGEMIFRLTEKLGIDIEEEAATAIYAAILTDTGMFNYDNTSPSAHEAAGELIKRGVNPKFVHREIFEKKSVAELRLLARALGTLEIAEDGKLAHMSLTRGMYEEVAGSVPTDEFINFPRSIKGIEVAVFFRENGGADGRINVSFRSSEKVDVDVIAQHFGGGGHSRAAGCILEGGLQEAREKVLAEARKALRS